MKEMVANGLNKMVLPRPNGTSLFKLQDLMRSGKALSIEYGGDGLLAGMANEY